MIYFAQPVEGGPIKIGHSVDVSVRIRQLENRFGRPLVLLGTLPGDRDEEQAIHARFSHLRMSGPQRHWQQPEQFRPGPDLLEFIGIPGATNVGLESVELMLPVNYDPSRNDKTARIDATVLGWAEMVAKAKGVSLAEYLTETLRSHVAKDFGKLMEQMKEGGGV